MKTSWKLIGTLSAFALLPQFKIKAEKQEKPNIILIMADDVGYECFGPYGSTQYKTPVLDTMASEGVRFTQAYSQPLCTPTRVKIMTGKSNIRNYYDFSLLHKEEKTFAHIMQDAGYTTAITGKWQLYGAEHYGEMAGKGMHPDNSGFNNYCLWQVKELGSRFWEPRLNLDGKIQQYSKDTYGPDIINQYACNFIENNKDNPFFLYYPMVLVHNPFVPTPDSADRTCSNHQQNFEDMMTYMDKCVGNIRAKLDSLGISDNTILIFTADNGTHRSITSELNGKTIKGGKGLTTDAGTRVPLIVQWPDKTPKGQVCDDLIDFSDFMPTIAEAAGASLPEGETIDGISFLPQIQGKAGTPRKAVYCYYNPRPSRRFTEKVFARDKRWKLYRNGNLFDVTNDVFEQNPFLAETDTPETASARKKLQQMHDSMPQQPLKINR